MAVSAHKSSQVIYSDPKINNSGKLFSSIEARASSLTGWIISILFTLVG
ncbi:hypothetical protein D082_10330 [Synechocystis sp. PCC 6714]|nr:hypothetical protein D082_10330 [Synechocystis sp. PCC 6714]